jgi:hypothetical protein
MLEKGSIRPSASNKLWAVIKSLKESAYRLSEGDLIRLGRVVYGVRKIGGANELADEQTPIRARDISEGGLNTELTIWNNEEP